MNDYVSRQYLLDEYDRQHQGQPGGARKIIAEAPAEDVKRVVRCQDCENWNTDWKSILDSTRHYCVVMDTFMCPSDFCSYGELGKGSEQYVH